MAGQDITEVGAEIICAGSQYAYIHIPAASLRQTVDSLFPDLAKNVVADAARGFQHRWAHGHDLLLDVAPRFLEQPIEALKHAGHVILTDFPTKAGIPIPGFSQSGLGHWLSETAGIPKGWMSMNIMDTGVGIFCIHEGAGDLRAALDGELPMNAWTFFDTFGEGTIELVAGIYTKNPFLLVSAAENYLAGVISTINSIPAIIDKYTYTVSPETFFGASVSSALIGVGISYLLHRDKQPKELTQQLLTTGGRTALIGGLGSLSAWFSAGAFLGFACIEIGKQLARNDTQRQILCCSCSPATYLARLQIFSENQNFVQLWNSPPSKLKITPSELRTTPIADIVQQLEREDALLRETNVALKMSGTLLKSSHAPLRTDCPRLS